MKGIERLTDMLQMSGYFLKDSDEKNQEFVFIQDFKADNDKLFTMECYAKEIKEGVCSVHIFARLNNTQNRAALLNITLPDDKITLDFVEDLNTGAELKLNIEMDTLFPRINDPER